MEDDGCVRSRGGDQNRGSSSGRLTCPSRKNVADRFSRADRSDFGGSETQGHKALVAHFGEMKGNHALGVLAPRCNDRIENTPDETRATAGNVISCS
jgi:hypothetical protein